MEALEGANERTLHTLLVDPNTVRRVPPTDQIFIDSASQLLIAGVGRFWLFTVGLVAVNLSRPGVSNTMWTVRLRGKDRRTHPAEGYHAQALWLNSTPGLLGLLALRQDNKGAFIQIKKEYIPLIPMLDYYRLSSPARAALEDSFKTLGKISAPSLPDQLREAIKGRGFRFDLDAAVLGAIAPGIQPTSLRGVYEEMLRETIIAPPVAPGPPA